MRRKVVNLCAFLATATILANPAFAETTYLLQLGSTDSEKEATDKGNEIKSKNTDVIGSLSLHIAQVALPPDNTVSYRMQIGPISSREQASTMCGTLQSRSVECYIVETAMFASEAPADQTDNGTRPATAATQPAAAATTSPAAALVAAEMTAPATPAVTTSNIPDATGAPEPVVTAKKTPAHTRAVVASAEDETSHAGDPDYIPPPLDSGPVIISTSRPSAPAAGQTTEMAEMPTSTAAAPAPHAAESEAAPASETKSPDASEKPKPETTVAEATPAPAPVTPPAEAKSPGFFSRLFGSSPPKAKAAEGVTGSINVAEAIRVPLSDTPHPHRQKIIPVLPSAYGQNNAMTGSKIIWAQIGYFRDEAQALDFYRRFNRDYPQYSQNVRVRITRPFANNATSRITLRMGPYIGADDVRTLCSVANHWNARCTLVRDIGAAAAANTTVSRNNYVSVSTLAQQSPAAGNPGVYWAQLGTFRSTDEAWDAWRDLKGNHTKALNKVKASVTTPASSSASTSAFRLRAGPMNLDSVGNLCGRLQSAGLDCIIVKE